MSDRRETGAPVTKETVCVRCNRKIESRQVEQGRGVYRWVDLEPGTTTPHTCDHVRARS
jgi:hypothetical protein